MPRKDPLPYLVAEAADDTLVVRFIGDEVHLGGDAVRSLAGELAALAPGQGQRTLLVDFGNVRSVSVLLLRVLVPLHRKLAAAGVRLTLCNLGPGLYEALGMAGAATLPDARRGVPETGAGESPGTASPHGQSGVPTL